MACVYRKILLGLPLYGYGFPCTGNATGAANVATGAATNAVAAAPACRVPKTADVAAWQVGLGTIFVSSHAILDRSSLTDH